MRSIKQLLLIILISLIPTTASAGSFDGTYNFKVKTTKGTCTAAPGEITIEDGKILGTINSDGKTFKVFGRVSEKGKLKGKIAGGLATFKGEFKNGKVQSSWRNRFGCSGTIFIS